MVSGQGAGLEGEVAGSILLTGEVRTSKKILLSFGSVVVIFVMIFDGRVAGHLGAAVGLKTLSIHVCVCPHFGM